MASEAKRIDDISRFIFPFSFAGFNVMYWCRREGRITVVASTAAAAAKSNLVKRLDTKNRSIWNWA